MLQPMDLKTSFNRVTVWDDEGLSVMPKVDVRAQRQRGASGARSSLGRDAAYIGGLGDIVSVLRYSGYDLQAFNLPHEAVTINDDIVDQMGCSH